MNLTPVKRRGWNVSSLFIARTAQAEHTVDRSHEMSTFQHALDRV